MLFHIYRIYPWHSRRIWHYHYEYHRANEISLRHIKAHSSSLELVMRKVRMFSEIARLAWLLIRKIMLFFGIHLKFLHMRKYLA